MDLCFKRLAAGWRMDWSTDNIVYEESVWETLVVIKLGDARSSDQVIISGTWKKWLDLKKSLEIILLNG